MTQRINTFLCTRPRIAAELIRQGFQVEIIPHPWKPNLSAWVFPMDEELRNAAVLIYTAMGISIPAMLVSEVQ